MSPSFAIKGGAKTDWSYSGRKRKKLQEAAADCKQEVITEHFEILDKVALLVKENDHLANVIKSLKSGILMPSTAEQKVDVTPILCSMMENATRNIGKSIKRRTHRNYEKVFHVTVY